MTSEGTYLPPSPLAWRYHGPRLCVWCGRPLDGLPAIKVDVVGPSSWLWCHANECFEARTAWDKAK